MHMVSIWCSMTPYAWGIGKTPPIHRPCAGTGHRAPGYPAKKNARGWHMAVWPFGRVRNNPTTAPTGRRSLMNTPKSENCFLPVYGHGHFPSISNLPY